MSFTIPEWVERPIVFFVLLYRRIRYGYAFRQIALTRGKYAIVEPEDYQRLSQFRWYPQKVRNKVYACRFDKWVKGRKRKSYLMHREIIQIPDQMVCDHINGDGLDNRKENLRPATRAQNSWNRGKSRVISCSRYKGLAWDKQDKRWEVWISTLNVGLNVYSCYLLSQAQVSKERQRCNGGD